MLLCRAGLGIALSAGLLGACARESQKPPADTTSQTVGTALPASVPGLGTLAGDVDAQFTEIAAVEELSDGRVLVLDVRNRLVVADFTSGKGEVIGGRGGGPKEHGNFIPTLARGPGGAIWFPDDANARFGVVSPDGKMSNPVLPRAMMRFGTLLAGDSLGNWYAPQWGQGDSTPINRTSSAGGRGAPVFHIVAQPLKRAPDKVEQSGDMAMVTIERSKNQWMDAWALFDNGDIIVARMRPFHLELLDASGKWIVGPEIKYESIKLTDTLSKRHGIAAKPPFFPYLLSQPVAAPDGSFWLRRTTAADNGPAEYDVYNQALTLVRHVVLPPNTDLVNVGAKHVYLSHEAPDGPRLVRYAF
jgi:hypothetical protein